MLVQYEKMAESEGIIGVLNHNDSASLELRPILRHDVPVAQQAPRRCTSQRLADETVLNVDGI